MKNSDFVLIVDDNPTNLSILSQALKSAGFAVRVAEDGESAIELVRHKLPALILLDVQMPGIDGFETCQRLKADPLTQSIPIIFMTALADTENKLKGLSLGAVDYIPKPFEQAEVIARVRMHLQLKQLTDNLEQKVIERTTELQKAQVQLVQQEKLSMLGQLVAGVAHEMNNPISCIISNIHPAQDYIADLTHVLQLCQQNYSQLPLVLQNAIAETDLEFILEDLPKLLNSMQVSTDRIKDISISLRNFARTDTFTKVMFDVHEGLDDTLLILRHRLKGLGQRPEIKIIKQYASLPKIECYPGQLNQVFMNILANAVDALEDVWQQGKRVDGSLTINICTQKLSPEYVTIRISDNGMGMTDDVKQRIFDSLFTTKALGKGTGLGLAIAHQIVVEKHGGTIQVNSTLNQGTEFAIVLPL
ncbi:hybrid sensor histidine kinase/response regulator [Nostoc sp. FACHB-152]|uniref:sensor histidine kinase n=1 Tax=unclassified Nostoc TaxID=2593658 RepID=UPI0016898E38|nr:MULTISPECIES: hybrid sensor histidine kinase/response regulator [unclassified Nostoc]MBD2446234.1 hybrid sensor histidine kinase/response regulator [Nostoc sp. FACHB-152]MBD2469504.1 hybrid sensor histidine kinase/response regulator [Nostoc sp. FACHB-145]